MAKINRSYLALYIFSAIISMAVFIQSLYFNSAYTDNYGYIKIAANIVKEGRFPFFRYPHFIYLLLLNSLTGFSANHDLIKIAAVFLLTGAFLLKVKLSSMVLDLLLEKQKVKISVNKKVLILLTLIFVFPIMNWWKFPHIFLGQFPPNLWHNPPTVMAMPFCLAFVFFVERQNTFPASVYGSIAIVLSVLTKPNFALVLLPSLFLLALLKRLTLKELLIYILPTIIVLLWQFFQYQPSVSGEAYHIIFSPMLVWGHYSKHPIGSLVVSLAFPVVVTLFFRKHFKNINLVILGWFLVFFSIAQFALLAESGVRFLHGNFIWASVPSLYILFLVLITELVTISGEKSKTFKIKSYSCYFILSLHFSSGIVFYIRNLLDYGARG